MVAQRKNIATVGIPLCEMIIAGNANSAKAVEMAVKLHAMLARVGVYKRQYESHEERVLHRHLNLYRNKLAAATSDSQRSHWREKIAEQKAKIAAFEGVSQNETDDLDLDGL